MVTLMGESSVRQAGDIAWGLGVLGSVGATLGGVFHAVSVRALHRFIKRLILYCAFTFLSIVSKLVVIVPYGDFLMSQGVMWAGNDNSG